MTKNNNYAEKCINACACVSEAALDGGWTAAGISEYAKKLEAENEILRALLTRYRNEVNIGHQPHMIVHQVDKFFGV